MNVNYELLSKLFFFIAIFSLGGITISFVVGMYIFHHRIKPLVYSFGRRIQSAIFFPAMIIDCFVVIKACHKESREVPKIVYIETLVLLSIILFFILFVACGLGGGYLWERS